MHIFLHGLAIQFYRGIGADTQLMAPFREVNVFIGANNSGKSTVLDFIAKFLEVREGEARPQPSAVERHQGSKSGNLLAAIGVPVENFVRNASARFKDEHERRRLKPIIERMLGSVIEREMIWLNLPASRSDGFSYLRKPTVQENAEIIRTRELQQLWMRIAGYTGGGDADQWLSDSLGSVLESNRIRYPKVNLIPAIRQFGPKSEDFKDYSGRGLIDRLAQIQSPDFDKRDERLVFDKINRFLQIVTGKENAEIDIPHNRDHVLVHMDNKVLPLQQLGTGIHEVIMIAAFCTLSKDQIVCIEEPELHLHPLLQRKLMDYLRKNTSNQYFIATHSPAFIDTPDAAIFHVTNDGSQTKIDESILRSSRVAICTDLGARASDIVQSNAVIWVEGPSDRIYVRHWVKALAPELVEGIHFSIMFYGGRLLSHLSANDDDISEFIGLRSLNQHLAIVMDSDKASNRAPINETKKRIRSEFEKKPGVAWVTRGREIENYIDRTMLQEAVKETHPTIYERPMPAKGAYDHALHFYRVGGRRRVYIEVDKVKVAKAVCRQPADLSVLDLRARVSELATMIRAANS